MLETELWERIVLGNEQTHHFEDAEVTYLEGSTSWETWRVRLYALDTGKWAYNLIKSQLGKHGGRSWGYRLQGPFDSPQQAVAAAEAERRWLEAGGRDV